MMYLKNSPAWATALIAQGKSNKEIAVLLNISVNTVAVHRAHVMETLGLHRTAEIVLYAVKRGLIVTELDGVR